MKSFNLFAANVNFALALIPGNTFGWVNTLIGFSCLLTFGLMLGAKLEYRVKRNGIKVDRCSGEIETNDVLPRRHRTEFKKRPDRFPCVPAIGNRVQIEPLPAAGFPRFLSEQHQVSDPDVGPKGD